MTILIYFIGVILSFLLGRYTYRMICINESITYDEQFLMANLIISFTSWFAFVAWTILYMIERPRKIKPNKKTPPR